MSGDWRDPFEYQREPAEGLPQPPQPPPADRKFCPVCGEFWQVGALECQACAAKRAEPIVAELAHDGGNPLVSPICLYLVLLGSTLIGQIFLAPAIEAFLVIDGFHTMIVISWIIGSGGIGEKWIIHPGYYLLMILASVVTFGVAMVVVDWLGPQLGFQQIKMSQPILDAGYGWWFVILVVCIEPPLIEELAFRGLILNSLRRVLSDRDAIFVSAFLFAVLHVFPMSYPHTILIGLFAGWARVKSGSLLPGILLHFIHNSLVIAHEANLLPF